MLSPTARAVRGPCRAATCCADHGLKADPMADLGQPGTATHAHRITGRSLSALDSLRGRDLDNPRLTRAVAIRHWTLHRTAAASLAINLAAQVSGGQLLS